MKDPKQMSWAKRNFYPYDGSDFAAIDWRPDRTTWVVWTALMLVAALILVPMWADKAGHSLGYWGNHFDFSHPPKMVWAMGDQYGHTWQRFDTEDACAAYHQEMLNASRPGRSEPFVSSLHCGTMWSDDEE